MRRARYGFPAGQPEGRRVGVVRLAIDCAELSRYPEDNEYS